MEYVHGHAETINNDGFLWIDLQKPSRLKLDLLAEKYPFHELNLEDCLSKIQLSKIDKYEDHIFVILHFPTIEKEKGISRFSQLSIFAGMNYLVTVHQGDLIPLLELFQHCKQSDTQRQALMGKSPGYLLHSIMDALVDDLLHTLMKIVGNLDDIEDSVFDDKKSEAKEISHLRREIMMLRRVVIPLKRTLLKITNDIQKFSEEDLTPYFADVEDHIEKILETLEEAKEVVEIYKDTDFMISTEKSNKILAVLTILFTLSIPVSTLATFYGMNIAMPGRIETPLTFFGPYTTMILIIASSIIPAICMLWYFHRAGWIGVS